jgi:uncharacterized membrane protein (TIGR02234 family)
VTPAPPAGSGRRELTATVVAAVVGAGLALISGGRAWAEITAQRRAPLPPVTAVITGSEAAPIVPAAALVLLAAAGALLAVRGLGRVAVGLVMVLAGTGMAWASGRVLAGADVVTTQLRALGVPAGDLSTDVAPGWPVVAVVAGALGIVAGVLTAVRGGRWPAMGRRYERSGNPGDRTPDGVSDEQRASAAWTALDRGEDPTDGSANRPS